MNEPKDRPPHPQHDIEHEDFSVTVTELEEGADPIAALLASLHAFEHEECRNMTEADLRGGGGDHHVYVGEELAALLRDAGAQMNRSARRYAARAARRRRH